VNASVVLPIRNGMSHIDRCIAYLATNCDDSDEIVVICNGSTDNSAAKLRSITQYDSRFRIIETGDIGLVRAMNLGVSESSNSWIFRVDVDDLYDTTRFQVQKEAILGNPRLVALFSDYQFMGGNDENLGIIPSAVHPSAVPISLVSGFRTPHPVAVFNKHAFFDAGGYMENDFPSEDLSLWLRISRLGFLETIPSNLLKYRISSGSVTSKNRSISKTKAADILNTIRLGRSSITNFNLDLSAILKDYEKYSHHEGRLILLAMDVLKLKKLGYISRSEFVELTLQFSRRMRPHLAKTLFTLYQEKNLRDQYRKLQSIS